MVVRALAKEPDQRFQSAGALRQALARPAQAPAPQASGQRAPLQRPPAAPAASQVLALVLPDGREVRLEGDVLTLGRDRTSDIPLADNMVSRRHARLRVSPQGVEVEDLGSTNGTFVNGQRLAPAVARRLQAGDRLGLGTKLVLRVQAATTMPRQAPGPQPSIPSISTRLMETPSPPQAPPKRGLPRLVWILGLAVAALVVVALGIAVASGVFEAEPTAETIYYVVVTDTPAATQPLLTSTPVAAATAAPSYTPLPLATSAPSQEEELALVDTFESADDYPSNQLAVGAKETVERFFADGEYHMVILDDDRVAWSRYDDEFRNFSAAVDARFVGGPERWYYGLIFRAVDSDNYYMFQVSNAETYRFQKQVDDEWDTVLNWTSTSAMNSGHATNRIQVLAMGSDIGLWINDALVNLVVDDSFEAGSVGMVAGSFDEPDVHVAFDNFELWVLP